MRQLLEQNNPNVKLPAPVETGANQAPDPGKTTQETYLGVNKQQNYGGQPPYGVRVATLAYPEHQPDNSFALSGDWNLQGQYIQPAGASAAIKLNYHANKVYMVVAGEGTLTIHQGGADRSVQVHGTPTLYEVSSTFAGSGSSLTVDVPSGIQAYSFTFG